MARIFVFDNREFPDPDSKLSVDDVRQMMALHMPELNNADVREEKRGEDTAHIFSKRIGTKGAALSIPAILPKQQDGTDVIKIGPGAQVLSTLLGWPIIQGPQGKGGYSKLRVPPAEWRKFYRVEVDEPDWGEVRDVFARATGDQTLSYLGQHPGWEVVYTAGKPVIIRCHSFRIGTAIEEEWLEVTWERGAVQARCADYEFQRFSGFGSPYPFPADILPPDPPEDEIRARVRRRIAELRAEGKDVRERRFEPRPTATL